MPAIDVFVDVSSMPTDVDVPALLARLAGPELLGDVAERITAGAIESCSRAMMAAADAERALLVVIGAIEPGRDALGLLLDAMDADPMIGFALPRLTGSCDDSLATVDRGGDGAV